MNRLSIIERLRLRVLVVGCWVRRHHEWHPNGDRLLCLACGAEQNDRGDS